MYTGSIVSFTEPTIAILYTLLQQFYFNLRVFGSPLRFNTSNWFQDQNVVIMAVDDDVIMESPYGAVVSMESFSPRPDFSKENNLTLVIMEGDRGEGGRVRDSDGVEGLELA